MKIAIYEPKPRVCGPMTCAQHLRTGLRQLGHEANLVTFTKSGKPSVTWGEGGMRFGVRWWSSAPDVVAKFDDAAEVLQGYDAVILSDVRTVFEDKQAVKGESALATGRPDYLVVLERAGVRFTTALHGNNYPPSEVPFAAELLALPGFTGTAITYSPTSPLLSKELWPDVRWVDSPLPYEMRSSPSDDVIPTHSDGRRHVGITGRYISVKGQHVFAVVAGRGMLAPGITVDLHGACSVGAAASASFKTLEALIDRLNLTGERFFVDSYGGAITHAKASNVIKPYPWVVTAPRDTLIKYHGNYTSGYDVCGGLDVHVDLTASSFSDGMEFSQFEAIDAGCLQVSVRSMWSDDFVGQVVPSVPSWPGEPRLINDERCHGLLESVAEGVDEAMAISKETHRVIAQENRWVLSTKHAPVSIASTFLHALGG